MSACKNLAQWNDTIFEKVAVALVCIAFGGAVCFLFCQPAREDASIVWISAFIGIANALLLFATLQSQNRNNSIQKETADRERFETTFFNLLKSHRQLVDEICIYRPSVSAKDITQIDNLMFKGRQFFWFAVCDINNINHNLKNSSLEHYNFKNAQEQVDYLYYCIDTAPAEVDTIDARKEMGRLAQGEREKMVNSYYDLKEKHLQEFKLNQHLPYQLFEKKMGKYYEHYVRSLIHLIDYIKSYGHNVTNYGDIVFSQMSMDEKVFLGWLIPTNDSLNSLINETKLYNILRL